MVQVSHEQIQEPERPIPISDSGQSILLSEEEIERIEEERIRNVVKLTATDQLNSEIITNRTRGEEAEILLLRYNLTKGKKLINLRSMIIIRKEKNWSTKSFNKPPVVK